MKKLIVFDWNGTILADTIHTWRAGNICLEYLGAAPISLKQYRDTFTFPILHFYKKNGLSVDHVLKHKDAANEVFQSAYRRFAANARTRVHTRALLEWVHEQKMQAIILSNDRIDHIDFHTRRLKIDRFFSHISAHHCAGTTILERTTKIERLDAYMGQHGFASTDTVIIGDSTEEPDLGRHFGLTSIGLTDGYISEARLRAAKPDYLVRSMAEIQALLARKFKTL